MVRGVAAETAKEGVSASPPRPAPPRPAADMPGNGLDLG